MGFEELLEFPGGVFGIAFNVDEDEIGVVLLGDYWHLHAGDEVERTGRVMDVAVGDGLLGRVIDPLGRPLDGKGPVAAGERLPIERPAPAIMDRAPVTVPLQTGLKVIDALIPIGRGQRELILGDRQTGKTAIAIDTILNQRGQDVVCVYCAIGQRASAVAKAVATLREKGAMEYTVVVVTEGNDPPGLAYIAPYAATSIAEHFMEAGRDVLIVYDDLTQHARAYRELSLLLRRPPGREAFPGDIFYIHSRLLERATHLREELGGGSLTALPIIETEAQNISAYIPTNLISITDGQIYLSPSLFELGVLPAVDVGKSVSRVGGKAQRAAYRAVAGDLKLAYAQFEELETFARFGARLDEDTRKVIEHGRRIRACLKQPEFSPVSVPAQIAVLLALTAELFDPVPLERMTDAERAVREAAAGHPGGACARASRPPQKLSDEDREAIVAIARQALARFQPKPERRPEPKPADSGAGGQAQGAPRRSHERHHGEPAPQDRQRRRSSVRRAHDEGPGRLEHRAIREIGARAWPTTTGPWSWAWARAFGKRGRRPRRSNRKDRPLTGAIGAVVFGSDQGLVGQFNEVVADHAIEGPRRAGPEGPSLGRRRARSCAPRGRRPAADGALRRAEFRQGHRPAGRADPRGERAAPRQQGDVAELHLFYNRPASGAVYAPVSQRLLPLDERLATQAGRASLADPKRCPRSWAAAPRPCARSSASISSSRSSGRAPNPSRARTRAAWRRWSAPTRTSTSCWRPPRHVPPPAPERHRRGAVRRHLRLRPDRLHLQPTPLTPDLLHRMDAYWRAANYLSVGQIYLYDNPLLKEPLTLAHVKPLVVGHWGTTPGQNFIYVHLNRVIKKYDLDMFYIAGPGHGGPAIVGNVYLEGTWSEVYPNVTPGRSRPEEAVQAVLVSRRDFQPRGADDAGIDSRRRRAGVLAQPCLRRRVRQSRSDRRVRHRRR